MFRFFSVAASLLAVSTLSLADASYLVPTTTLAAQTAKNSSAASSFTAQTNGNTGARNVSKVDVHSLLYAGAETKIYAHLLLWFGGSNHMNVGYNSDDAAQVQRQISDMVSRGIDGVIVDWYGQNNSIDDATKLVMAEAEKHPGFTFAIMVDQGAIEWFSCSGCSPQQALVNDLQYIEQTYFPSPAYVTVQGQPVITNFNVDLSYSSVDWKAAIAALSTHPVLVFQNNDGFTHTLTDGSYAWVMPTTNDYGIGYLSSFYHAGMGFPSLQTIGATYKGFNDSKASWGSNRIMGQQCGQTWLQTFSEINDLYSSGKQLTDLQLVTWNDYEEATEIESGIENCVSLSPSLSANALQWNISGDENTVDHYTVYISADGQNLMSLTDLVPGNRSLNLCSFPIPNGNYKMFVQAVGKPSLANQISEPVSYSASCSAQATVSLSAAPNSITVSPGVSGGLTVTATAQGGLYNSPISLSCSGIPASVTCSFSPATITPNSGVASSTLTITAASVAGMNLPQRNKPFPILAGLLLPFAIGGVFFVGSGPGRRMAPLLALIAVVGLGVVSSSCGGGTGTTQTAQASATSYAVTIHGSSSSSQLSTTVHITVQ